jgi:hypothetical protein
MALQAIALYPDMVYFWRDLLLVGHFGFAENTLGESIDDRGHKLVYYYYE